MLELRYPTGRVTMSHGNGLLQANRMRIGAWALVPLLLLVPLVAMQFTSEVRWGIEDFAAAALLLGGAGLALEAVLRFVHDRRARIVLGMAVLAALVLVWAELAVGLF